MQGSQGKDAEEADFSFLQGSDVPETGAPGFGGFAEEDSQDSGAGVRAESADFEPAVAAEEGAVNPAEAAPASDRASAGGRRSERSGSSGRERSQASRGNHLKTDAGTAPPSKPTQPKNWLLGYALFLTLLLLYLLLTGKIHLNSNHPLESLPDIRPLAPNEFQAIPEDAALPAGHELQLGQSQRFGDIEVTPLRVTREALSFEDFQTGEAVETPDMEPKLKLWMRIRNVSAESSFPPFDADLMSHRSPPYSTDENTLVNSALWVATLADAPPVRVLNFHHSRHDPLVLSGQNAGKVLAPGQEFETWIASAVIPEAMVAETSIRWRIQIRKGVNQESLNGVTTLFDCSFRGADIEAEAAGNG